MNKIAAETILTFLGFNNKDLEHVAYLINIGKTLDCEDELRMQIRDFDQKDIETSPEFYVRMFLSELSWQITQLVCAEFYPDQALRDVEDFGLFFQDYWLDNEDKNEFYDFFGSNDLTDMTKRQIVELAYEKLQIRFQTFFN